jgi:hypothetical protein
VSVLESENGPRTNSRARADGKMYRNHVPNAVVPVKAAKKRRPVSESSRAVTVGSMKGMGGAPR